MPFPLILLLHINGQVKNGAALFDFTGFFFFKKEITTGLKTPTIDLGHEIRHPGTGF